MKHWIDVTLPLRDGMPVWPGDPAVKVHRIRSRAGQHCCTISALELGTHSGTHFDAPSHFLPAGPTMDNVPLEAGLGPCRVIDVRGLSRIEPEHLSRALIPQQPQQPGTNSEDGATVGWPRHQQSERPQRLVLKTGAADRIMAGEFPADFAGLSVDAARAIVEAGTQLLATDAPSVGPFDDPAAVHEILLSGGVILLESLLLTDIKPGNYEMLALPLRLQEADGAPARVLLRPLNQL